jgi:hypothetical protein
MAKLKLIYILCLSSTFAVIASPAVNGRNTFYLRVECYSVVPHKLFPGVSTYLITNTL